jgi:hypothetical protein
MGRLTLFIVIHSMNAFLYHVRFVGGPSDGLVIQATSSSFKPKKKLSLSESPIFVRHNHSSCYEFLGHRSSAYQMTSKHYREDGGFPTMHLRYDFLAFEYLGHQVANGHSAISRRRWLTVLSQSASRHWSKLVKWMLTPVD